MRQIRWHQQYLAAFESRGSSANNHVIAEAAGQLAASCAFPWFAESERWRRDSALLLERELAHNTFPSGINRELASDYHGFVAELGFFAAIEASAAGTPLSDATWRLLCAMADGMAALVDERVQPPRQGDSDEGRVVLLDAPEHNRWPALLALGDALFGRLDWWPPIVPDAGSALAGACSGGGRPGGRGRPDAAPVPLRGRRASRSSERTRPTRPRYGAAATAGRTVSCRIAAHAHADALSVEVRYGGVDILADPGTYCYHGEPEWRSYFRSTIAHNTVEIGGRSQSAEGGPFMWLRHARTREIDVPDAELNWTAEHDGYSALSPPAWHRRSVRLDPDARAIEITDVIDGGGHEVRLAFHFGPLVRVSLDGAHAELAWPDAAAPGSARLELPAGLEWRVHRGAADPILGWYSDGTRAEDAGRRARRHRCQCRRDTTAHDQAGIHRYQPGRISEQPGHWLRRFPMMSQAPESATCLRIDPQEQGGRRRGGRDRADRRCGDRVDRPAIGDQFGARDLAEHQDIDADPARDRDQ